MPLSPFSLPVPLDPSESALGLLTTVGVKTELNLAYGAIPSVGPSSGEIDRWRSHPLTLDTRNPGYITYSGLAPLGIPQASVTKIYAAAIVDFAGILGYQSVDCSSPALGTVNAWGHSTPVVGQVSALYASGAAAQTLDLSTVTFTFVNNSSVFAILTPPGSRMQLFAVGLVVYYAITAIPIGHGANCNAYGPVSVSDGATTPPGNGLLIN